MINPVRKSRFSSWIIIGAIALIIVAITGIFVYSNRSDKYPVPTGWINIRPPHAILALAEQGSIIWAGGADGLFTIDRNTGKIIPSNNKERTNVKYIRDLCIDRQGGLWIAHEKGLTHIYNEQQHTYTVDDGLPQGFCAAVIEDHAGNIWVGTETGIAKFDGSTWHNLTPETGFGAVTVSVIYEDKKGILWFGSDSINNLGLMRYDGKNWSSFPTTTGMVAHDTITDIMEDKDGNLWVASGIGDAGGATCVKENGVTTLTMADGLRGGRVRSIFEDSLGRLWFASEFQGSVIFDGQNQYVITPEEGMAGWEVMDMVEDSSGILWLATENGVTRITSVNAVPAN